MSINRFSSHTAPRGMLLALGLIATGAYADELPMRKAGLWEMKMMTSSMNIAMRHCTSPAVEREMQQEAMSYENCSKQEIHKTATGYIIDAICQTDEGEKITTHTEITGDFDSAYTMKQSGQIEGESETNVAIQAKWLGACPSGWKPGDIKVEMPGNFKNAR